MNRRSSDARAELSITLSGSLLFRYLPCTLSLLALGAGYLSLRFSPYPSLTAFQKEPYSRVVMDRHGKVIALLPLDEGMLRIHTPLEDLPSDTVAIFVGSEDRRFRAHPGVDPLALGRAIRQYAVTGEIVSGGSTITMQLADIIAKRTGKTFRSLLNAKMIEIVNALRLESRFSKDRLLEMWLNNLPFGRQNSGVAAAAYGYFNEPPGKISPEEWLLLSVIPRNPTLYNPLEDPGLAVDRAMVILKRVAEATEKEIFDLIDRPLIEHAASKTQPRSLIRRTPHFTMALPRLDENFKDDIGREPYRSSLDLPLNEEMTLLLEEMIEANGDSRITNGSLLAIDNNTGEILLYVGSKDFFDKKNNGEIDGIFVRSQPGSTLKPFLYALAIEMGFLPNTILPDIPTDYGGEKVYTPINFNRRFNGPVRLRTALASSLNAPAVYTLYHTGVDNFSNFLIELGFESLISQRNQVGLGLALGNAEVSLLELTRTFAVFPRDGIPLKLTSRRMSQQDDTPSPGERIISAYTSRIICDILSDAKSRAVGFADTSLFNRPYDVMLKTGTANQSQHIWAVMATSRYTVGVWMGDFSGNTVVGITGSALPALLASQALSRLENGKSPLFFAAPTREKVRICALSGGRANSYDRNTLFEYLPPGEDILVCTYHNGSSTPLYPAEYGRWLSNNGINGRVSDTQEIRIITPNDGSLFYLTPEVPEKFQGIRFEAHGDGSALTLLRNGIPFQELSPPYRTLLPVERGKWSIEAQGRGGVARTSFEVR